MKRWHLWIVCCVSFAFSVHVILRFFYCHAFKIAGWIFCCYHNAWYSYILLNNTEPAFIFMLPCHVIYKKILVDLNSENNHLYSVFPISHNRLGQSKTIEIRSLFGQYQFFCNVDKMNTLKIDKNNCLNCMPIVYITLLLMVKITYASLLKI